MKHGFSTRKMEDWLIDPKFTAITKNHLNRAIYVQTNTWTFMTPKTGRDSVSRAIQDILTGCLRTASCKRTLESPDLNDASGTLHPPNPLRKKPRVETVDGESPTEQAWLGLRLGLGTPSGWRHIHLALSDSISIIMGIGSYSYFIVLQYMK